MLDHKELRYMLALQRVHGLGTVSARRLLQRMGSARAVFGNFPESLHEIGGKAAVKLVETNVQQLLEEADAELEFAGRHDIGCVVLTDSAYPHRLRHCPDGPLLLFYKGNICLENRRIISVVGSRISTPSGRENCRRLLAELVPYDPVVVSGLAFGIDICAHRAAMEVGLQTIACLGHGMDKVYPAQHRSYLKEMCRYGGAFTEFWSSDVFDKINFVRRNRIIAGLSEATIVVESAEKGGSLITAQLANSYNREVFAFPGRVGDRQSRGCNKLIKTEQARLIERAADLVYILGWEMERPDQVAIQPELFPQLSPEEQKIYDQVDVGQPALLDEIAIESGFSVRQVAATLIALELKGLIRPLPGKRFERI